ncbi:hypothetical protein HKX48_003963 [Thoreauomyces humboldtii]|nr:hypothetical protein HKX48_003963 [Thoreauomyces humboldtii]
MSAISATPEVILGFSFYSLAQVCGIFNVLYALRFDLLYRAWAPRNAITTVAQLFLSASHAVSFYYGYEYQKHYVENPDFYEDGLRISDQFFIFGAFLLLYALQALLPAIQGKLRYDPKWNIALKAVNAGTFFICLIGHVVSTIIIVRAERNGGKADDSVLQLRTLFFTAWAIYAPVMMILIAIMVSFMVLAAKKQLAAAGVTVEKALHSDDQENGTPRETAAEILESIKKKTLWSTCICIPLTIGVAGYTAGPYSVIADGVATFCESIG